jgi:hypothetical protein
VETEDVEESVLTVAKDVTSITIILAEEVLITLGIQVEILVILVALMAILVVHLVLLKTNLTTSIPHVRFMARQVT